MLAHIDPQVAWELHLLCVTEATGQWTLFSSLWGKRQEQWSGFGWKKKILQACKQWYRTEAGHGHLHVKRKTDTNTEGFFLFLTGFGKRLLEPHVASMTRHGSGTHYNQLTQPVVKRSDWSFWIWGACNHLSKCFLWNKFCGFEEYSILWVGLNWVLGLTEISCM